MEAARLTPTSSSLQPFEIILITNVAVHEKIKTIANGQTQLTGCSHLLVFATWANYTAGHINMMFDLTNAERGGKSETSAK